MRIPRVLLINGNLWKVKFSRRPGGFSADQVLGLCCPDDRLIVIAIGLSIKLRIETFVHEVIHALAFEYGEKQPSLERLLNHKFIAKVEDKLAALLIDNQIRIG